MGLADIIVANSQKKKRANPAAAAANAIAAVSQAVGAVGTSVSGGIPSYPGSPASPAAPASVASPTYNRSAIEQRRIAATSQRAVPKPAQVAREIVKRKGRVPARRLGLSDQQARLASTTYSMGEKIGATEGELTTAVARSLRGRDANYPEQGRMANVAVPSVVPQQYRRAVAKHGQRLNEPLEGTGVTGPEYLGHLIQFESGWDPKAYNPSSASGLGQFIDSTAEDFRSRLGVETQDPSRPKQMIKGASLHASGDVGYGALYGGYNPGYGSDPIIGPASDSQNVNVKAPRKALRRVANGRVSTGSSGSSAPEQMGGAYAGSKRALRQLLGPYAKTEDWKDKEPGHSVGGLHDPANEVGYAADVSTSEDLIDYVAKKLGRTNPGISPETVDYGTTGLESGLTFKGYDVEWLPYTHGSGPHDHLGLEWNGGSLPSGTSLGGPTSTGGGVAVPASVASATAPSGATPPKRATQEPRGTSAPAPRQAFAASAHLPDAFGKTRFGQDEEGEEEEEDSLAAILRGRPLRNLRRRG